MLSSVCELPLPSSFVQTMRVLSSSEPPPPGSGVSERRLRQVGQLFAVPFVDAGEFLDRVFVRVGLVRRLVMAFVDAEPIHVGVADRVGVLQRGDAGEIGGEAVDHEARSAVC